MALFRRTRKLKGQPLGLLKITEMRLPDMEAFAAYSEASQKLVTTALALASDAGTAEETRRVDAVATRFTHHVLAHVSLAPGVTRDAAGQLIYGAAKPGVAMFSIEVDGGLLPDGPFVDPRVQNALILFSHNVPDTVHPSAQMLMRWVTDSAYVFARAESLAVGALPWAFGPQFLLEL